MIPRLLIIFMLGAIPIAGQTLPEIEQAYGKPALAYSVTESIWMTPAFAADGQVCRMEFYPKRFDRGTAYIGRRLVFEELKWILNQVVPPSLRGKRKTPFSLSTGRVLVSEIKYEKVSFKFVSSMRQVDPGTLKLGEPVKLDSEGNLVLPEPPPPKPSDRDFDETTWAQMVTLSWNDRTCAETIDDGPVQASSKQQFGEPQRIYAVGSFTLMTPEFASDGQICQMWVYPRRFSGTGFIANDTLVLDELRLFLNRLVPPEQRGLKQFTFTISYTSAPVVNDRSPSASDFSRSDPKEIAIVKWQHRTCAGL